MYCSNLDILVCLVYVCMDVCVVLYQYVQSVSYFVCDPHQVDIQEVVIVKWLILRSISLEVWNSFKDLKSKASITWPFMILWVCIVWHLLKFVNYETTIKLLDLSVSDPSRTYSTTMRATWLWLWLSMETFSSSLGFPERAPLRLAEPGLEWGSCPFVHRLRLYDIEEGELFAPLPCSWWSYTC